MRERREGPGAPPPRVGALVSDPCTRWRGQNCLQLVWGWLRASLPPSLHPADPCPLCPQLYELDGDPKRKEFLDDLFSFMQKRGEHLPGQEGMMGSKAVLPWGSAPQTL